MSTVVTIVQLPHVYSRDYSTTSKEPIRVKAARSHDYVATRMLLRYNYCSTSSNYTMVHPRIQVPLLYDYFTIAVQLHACCDLRSLHQDFLSTSMRNSTAGLTYRSIGPLHIQTLKDLSDVREAKATSFSFTCPYDKDTNIVNIHA
jgi:hypothetical protein